MKRIVLSIIIIAVAVVAFANHGLQAQTTPGTFTWGSGSLSLGVGESKTVTLSLSTGGQETTGVDVLLNYNSAIFDVTNVDFFSNPKPYPLSFYNKDTASQQVHLSSTYDNIAQAYSGSTVYATLTIRGVAAGTSSLSYACSQGATNDTNIMQRLTSIDILNCASLANLGITVQGSNPDPTNTPTTPPTANPTAVPTDDPTDDNNDDDDDNQSNNNNNNSNQCSNLQTAPSNLRAVAQSGTSMLLTWNKEPNATYYTLKFGLSANNYQFGALDIGKSDRFLVTNLKPSTTYYFAIAGKNACSTSPFVTASARTLGSGVTGGGTRATARPNTGSTQTVPTPFVVAPSFDDFITQNTQGATDTVNSPSISDEIPGDLGSPEPVEDFLGGTQTGRKLPFNLPVPVLLGIIIGIVVLCIGIILFVTRKPKEEEQPVSTDAGGMKEV